MTEAEPFAPRRSSAPLIVYIDIKSPYAFIAVKPTRDLCRRLGVQPDWRPLTLNIPSYLGSAKLDARGKVVESKRTASQWGSVKYAYRDARRYAALQGFTLRGTVKIWDTSFVHIAFLWSKRHGVDALDRFIDQVYPPFWRRELDVEDERVLVDVLRRAEVPVAGFLDYLHGAGRAEHNLMQQAVFADGIFGVPGYVVAGEYFFGREHLPYIGWILGGREGPAPLPAFSSFADA